MHYYPAVPRLFFRAGVNRDIAIFTSVVTPQSPSKNSFLFSFSRSSSLSRARAKERADKRLAVLPLNRAFSGLRVYIYSCARAKNFGARKFGRS